MAVVEISRAANRGCGGGNWGILPWTPHLQGVPSYKQQNMRLKIFTSTFCRLNKKQLSVLFKFYDKQLQHGGPLSWALPALLAALEIIKSQF